MVPPPAEDPSPAGGSDGTAAEADTDDAASRRDEGANGDGTTPRQLLLDAIEEPSGATRRLPHVLAQLEADEQSVRLLAATACCRIAVATDDERIVAYLIRRMSDRLTDEEVSLELTAALDYLAAAFPDQVEPLLAELTEDRRDLPLPRVGNFTRIAGEGRPENPHQLVAGQELDERERIARERRRRKRMQADADEDSADDDGGADGPGAAGEATDGDSQAGSFTASPDTAVGRTEEISDIAVRSRFDTLHVQGERHRGRYATTYETLVGEGSDQRAVALRLLRQPEDGPPPAFRRELGERLRRWADASDHDAVVTVYDWGVDSRPWVATALIGRVLAERDRPAPATAFRHALALADAVAHLHGNGVVHGGLDARTVGYPGERFDDGDGDRGPLVNNVGLLHVYRQYVDPSDCLDPRYAAPEYYDDRFGRIDNATDIYQLGTVFYRLFTGRPPFAGSFDAVRKAVLSKTPPAPSAAVESLPRELDELLAKAMAKQKLRRYETVEQLRGELASLADEYG
jgi:hypothetical protein